MIFKEVARSIISRGYVKVDGLGETLLLTRTKSDKIDRRVKHVNFTCFENATSRRTSLPQHDPESTSNDEAFRELKCTHAARARRLDVHT